MEQETEENPVYHMVNLMQGGDLVNMFNEEGPKAVYKFCKYRLRSYLYDNGKSGRHVIRLDEYSRWRGQMRSPQTVNYSSVRL